jgi:hypothetical protein
MPGAEDTASPAERKDPDAGTSLTVEDAAG